MGAVPSSQSVAIDIVLDYSGAWTADRGRCHRLVYDPDGKPANCPEAPVASGWRQDYQGRWYPVDACVGHAGQLVSRPRPPSGGR